MQKSPYLNLLIIIVVSVVIWSAFFSIIKAANWALEFDGVNDYFLVPDSASLVRAMDRAGNVRDESADAYVPFSTGLVFIIVAVLLVTIYYFRHRIIIYIRKVLRSLLEK